MPEELKRSIVKTLIYADIFEYPLTIDEVWKFLIADKKITKKQLITQIRKIKVIVCFNNFYFLRGREKIVKKRLKRQEESEKKVLIAKKAVLCLFLIPSISLIGVSGGLAMKNSDKNDDIDFFIICERGTVWVSRLLSILILKLLGLHRSYKSQNIENKICLNMIIDQTALNFSARREDLYNAHEIVQMLPLFERNGMYKKFIKANNWLVKFLPNGLDAVKFDMAIKRDEFFISVVLHYVLRFPAFETLAKAIQFWRIEKRKTREIVSDSFLAFHPKDYRKLIIEKFEKKLSDLIII